MPRSSPRKSKLSAHCRTDDTASTERLRRLARSILRRCVPEEIVADNSAWQVVNAWPYGDLYVLKRRNGPVCTAWIAW